MAGTARLMAVSARRGISRESLTRETSRAETIRPRGRRPDRDRHRRDSRSRPLFDTLILEASVAGGFSYQLLVSTWRVSRKNLTHLDLSTSWIAIFDLLIARAG